jgi:hypothetical protein
MDAIGVLIVGIGVWLVYSAYKNQSPFGTALSDITAASTPTSNVPTAAGGNPAITVP